MEKKLKNQNKIFIIEHLEPKLWPWCIIEYKHISRTVSKKNVWFTNIKKSDIRKLSSYGKVFSQSIKEMKLDYVCVLDPESNITLDPKNSSGFQYFIFGGILGDNPPRKRTTPELTQFLPNAKVFNIGKAQMSTDNAVYVVKKIISGTNLKKIPFQEEIEIKINKIESTILPYRYALVKGKPFYSKELLKYLKEN
jgi:ribosome biogenesis SPOUT family RNA methylase Rps3